MSDQFGEHDFSPPGEIWTYRARPNLWTGHDIGVVDGDTYDLAIDAGFSTCVYRRIRAKHIDTAETFGVKRDTDQYRTGSDQARFVRQWVRDAWQYAEETSGVPNQWPLLLRTEHTSGAFNRYVGEVYDWRGNSLEKAVIDEYGDDYLW